MRRVLRKVVSRFRRATLDKGTGGDSHSAGAAEEVLWSRCLAELEERLDNVFFIQVGANDGKSFDPIYDAVKTYGWSGVVMEPLSRVRHPKR